MASYPDQRFEQLKKLAISLRKLAMSHLPNDNPYDLMHIHLPNGFWWQPLTLNHHAIPSDAATENPSQTAQDLMRADKFEIAGVVFYNRWKT